MNQRPCYLGFDTVHKCPNLCKGECGYHPSPTMKNIAYDFADIHRRIHHESQITQPVCNCGHSENLAICDRWDCMMQIKRTTNPMTFTVNSEMHSEISFALSCYLDDLATEITKQEKKTSQHCMSARRRHAKLQKWLLTEFNPEALTGKLTLMNGDTI